MNKYVNITCLNQQLGHKNHYQTTFSCTCFQHHSLQVYKYYYTQYWPQQTPISTILQHRNQFSDEFFKQNKYQLCSKRIPCFHEKLCCSHENSYINIFFIIFPSICKQFYKIILHNQMKKLSHIKSVFKIQNNIVTTSKITIINLTDLYVQIQNTFLIFWGVQYAYYIDNEVPNKKKNVLGFYTVN
eukprot:TRINITY_DN5104_c0_g1_i5.p1 TRINITY_DN5104_c0_g1~~TRINITY_DN5104_c0_g1_i5.p1  ORF type:complete len:198 (+),score=-21.32 TRINITY_DN5104_c0_g1_i5:39-596(+)